MDLTDRNFDLAFRGFKTLFNDGMAGAPTHALDVAMRVTSTGCDETYGWLGNVPQLREWIGDRVIHKLASHGFTIENVDFESTVEVDRNNFADDKLGLYSPMFSELGRLTGQHREELVFGLLARGFETEGYDGQPFFDTAHSLDTAQGGVELFSNMQDGAGPAWFRLDTSRAVRALIWQERKPYDFVAMDRPGDDSVFMNRKLIYGVDARVNAGFGLPQLAFGSKAELTATNYAAARAAMMGFKTADGRKLGIQPNILVVLPELEEAALHIANTDTNDGGGSNPWKGTSSPSSRRSWAERMPDVFTTLLTRVGGPRAPDWVHLLDVGRNAARDGRVFLVDDPDALVAAFGAGGIDLPVDDHHQTDKPPAGYAGPVPAAGWMKAIRREGARILGRVDWTAQAADLLATKGFRFLSPALRVTRDGRVLAIKGAGLVHDPALPLTALASQETPMTDPADLMAALVDLMGLPDSATADDILAATRTLMDGAADTPGKMEGKARGGDLPGSDTAMVSVQPDPARTVPIEVFHEAMAGPSAQTATLAEERVQTKVGAALRDGHITPGMRDWAVALCRQD
ncbi:MAG: Mu-like prophage major head subunit gpT family protein, partial [Pseudomonadota bacterium]